MTWIIDIFKTLGDIILLLKEGGGWALVVCVLTVIVFWLLKMRVERQISEEKDNQSNRVIALSMSQMEANTKAQETLENVQQFIRDEAHREREETKKLLEDIRGVADLKTLETMHKIDQMATDRDLDGVSLDVASIKQRLTTIEMKISSIDSKFIELVAGQDKRSS